MAFDPNLPGKIPSEGVPQPEFKLVQRQNVLGFVVDVVLSRLDNPIIHRLEGFQLNTSLRDIIILRCKRSVVVHVEAGDWVPLAAVADHGLGLDDDQVVRNGEVKLTAIGKNRIIHEWGINVSTATVEKHVDFAFFRAIVALIWIEYISIISEAVILPDVGVHELHLLEFPQHAFCKPVGVRPIPITIRNRICLQVGQQVFVHVANEVELDAGGVQP